MLQRATTMKCGNREQQAEEDGQARAVQVVADDQADRVMLGVGVGQGHRL